MTLDTYGDLFPSPGLPGSPTAWMRRGKAGASPRCPDHRPNHRDARRLLRQDDRGREFPHRRGKGDAGNGALVLIAPGCGITRIDNAPNHGDS